MNRILKVGIAGYGVVGKRRAQCVNNNPNLELVAICDQTFDKSGRTEDGINFFDNYRSLINEFKNSDIGKNSKSFETLSISETLPLIKNCDCYVGSDTGFAHLAVALGVKSITLFMDSPVLAYGKYSSRMIPIEPEGEKNSTTHNTFGKDKISIEEVLSTVNKVLD